MFRLIRREHLLLIIGVITSVIFTACSTKTIVVENPGDALSMNSDSESVVLGKSSEITKDDVQELITAWLDTINIEGYITDPRLQKPISKELKRFYNFNRYQLAWSTMDSPNSESKNFLNALAEADEHGLNADDYRLRKLAYDVQQVYSRKKRVNLLEVIQLDMDMTLSYLLYAHHLYNGRVDPNELGGSWQNQNNYDKLAQYMTGKSVSQVLSMVQPKVAEYKRLQQELISYRSIAGNGGWQTLPPNTMLREGDEGEYIYTLRRRLDKSGDLGRSLGKSSGNSYYFDSDLVEAVRKFQKRHGLEPNGIVNQETIRELNRPVSERIEQIKVNLERIRWMPRELGGEYITINVPAFSLSLVKGGRIHEKMKVIVGNTFSATPILHADMSYIMFSPTWNVPGPVFVRQLMPEVKKDSKYLENNGYELYATVADVGKKTLDPASVNWDEFIKDYPHFKVVQKPGPDNEQGRVKFVLPNNFNIFLSDAASPSMFEETTRAFNYRCISVEKPVILAESLLTSRKWREDDIKKSMTQDTPVKATLPSKIPVYITYRTCWVDENGDLNFRADIYGFDEAQYQFTHPEYAFEEEF